MAIPACGLKRARGTRFYISLVSRAEGLAWIDTVTLIDILIDTLIDRWHRLRVKLLPHGSFPSSLSQAEIRGPSELDGKFFNENVCICAFDERVLR